MSGYRALMLRHQPVSYWTLLSTATNQYVDLGSAGSTLSDSGAPPQFRHVSPPITGDPGSPFLGGNGASTDYMSGSNSIYDSHAGASGQMTICGWFRPHDVSRSAQMLVAKGNGSGYQFDMRINSDGTVNYGTFLVNGSNDVLTAASTEKLVNDRWYHLGFTYDRALPELRGYINGRLAAYLTTPTGPTNYTSASSVASLMIGRRADAGGTTLWGNVAHVAYYPTALPGTVIRQMAQWGQRASGLLVPA